MNDATLRPAPSSAKLRLAGHELDLGAGVLRDAAGAPVAMRPQAWAVLRLLAQHVGSVVTKEQMLDAVWPGLVVTDGSLAQAVSDVRSAFGDAGHRVIKTVARRGYVLAAPEAVAAEAGRVEGLPIAPGPLFGRDADLDALRGLLAQHRLVTVTGAGGIGKTALALAAAHAHAAGVALQAGWVDLARIAAPGLLPATLARALGLPISQGDDPLPGLLAALKRVRALVVLDNAEHLIDAVADIVRQVLGAAAEVRLLVTSQAPLRIEGERVLRLDALEVPAREAPFEQAMVAGAVALFADRARAADHRFELAPENIETVIGLCARLDGLPLAIRLAAARLPLLGLTGLAARMTEHLQLLSADSRDAPTRQQTLLAALEWSHALLPVREQAMFRRLGVFVGGFTIELAVAVCSDADRADEWAVIDSLASLAERSLVSVGSDEPLRYRMLESQRAFALRLLEVSGELRAARLAHARAVASALAAGAAELWSMADADWLARWAPEIDNVRAALDWSAVHDMALFASLVGSAPALYRLLDIAYELRRRAAAIDVAHLADVDAAEAARYWNARAFLQGGVSAASAHDFAREAERLTRGTGDSVHLYLALCQRGASGQVPADEADALLAEIAHLASPTWPPRRQALRWLAEFAVHTVNGRQPEALHAAEAGFALAEQAGSHWLLALFGTWIVVALLDSGDVNGATLRSRAMAPRILAGSDSTTIPFIGTCARCAMLSGDLAGAKEQLARMFELCRSVEWNSFEPFAGLYLRLALLEGRLDATARLLGYATVALERAWGRSRPIPALEEAEAALASAMAPARLAQLRVEGEGLSPEGVCALVLGEARSE